MVGGGEALGPVRTCPNLQLSVNITVTEAFSVAAIISVAGRRNRKEGDAPAMPQRRRLARKGQDRRGETSIRAAWGRPGQASRSSQIRGPASGWITGSTSACEKDDASDGHVGFFDINKAREYVSNSRSHFSYNERTIRATEQQHAIQDLGSICEQRRIGKQDGSSTTGPTIARKQSNAHAIETFAGQKRRGASQCTMPSRSRHECRCESPLRIAVTNRRY